MVESNLVILQLRSKSVKQKILLAGGNCPRFLLPERKTETVRAKFVSFFSFWAFSWLCALQSQFSPQGESIRLWKFFQSFGSALLELLWFIHTGQARYSRQKTPLVFFKHLRTIASLTPVVDTGEPYCRSLMQSWWTSRLEALWHTGGSRLIRIIRIPG